MIVKKVVILFMLGLLFTTNLWAVTAPFTDDMEDIVTTWTLSVGANDWERGVPTGGNVDNTFPTPPPLAHPSKDNCWGTNLSTAGGNYNKNRDSRLISPEIDVGSGNTPFLSCYVWYKIAAGDYATVEVKTVLSTQWDTLEQINPGSDSSTVPGNINGWVKKLYNLSAYTGNIQVSFRLVTDNKNQDLGLYVDDVAVGTNYDTQNRYIIAIEPEPTPVSISGTTNNMTVRVELRDLFRFIDSDPSLDGTTVTLQGVENNPNGTLDPPSSSSTLSSGKASFTFTNTEREEVTFTPSVTISGQSLTSVSATGRFLSPFRNLWKEKE